MVATPFGITMRKSFKQKKKDKTHKPICTKNFYFEISYLHPA